MNNLDPEVAERPDDLVVYGGSGRAARSWDAVRRHRRVAARRSTTTRRWSCSRANPWRVFRTHANAPRVLIANSLLVPHWATWEIFRDLERKGLTMYGQMTAGSWIYIGTQGILQGTYETLASLARRHFGGSLAGRTVVTAGLGGMGGAQPLAATMNGARSPRGRGRSARGSSGGSRPAIVDEATTSLDDALDRRWRDGRATDEARSIGLRGQRRRRAAGARRARRRARRGDRSDLGARRAQRLRAARPVAGEAAARAPRARSGDVHRASRWRAMGDARPRDARAAATAAASCSTTATTSARRRRQAGVDDAFDIPGFVPEYIRPLFCEGKGPFRWAALSGDPADIAATDRAVLELFPDDEALARWIPAGRASAWRFRDCRRASAGWGTASAPRSACRINEMVRTRRAEGADRHRPRSSRHRLGRLAQSRDGRHARWQRRDRRLADPQRAAERVGRRHVGVGAPRRRRRHRLLAARRHGHRRRRHATRPTRGSSAC